MINKMKILEDHNTRAEAMWQIICSKVDFANKNVIDLGCGHGDILRKIRLTKKQDTNGTGLWGIDMKEPENWHSGYSTFSPQDINEWVKNAQSFPEKHDWPRFDIAMCFSVLPYLDDIPATLKWMARNFPICLIECQYNGDGPGLSNIGGDRGMMQYLLNEGGFSHAVPIGKTRVEGRKYPDGNLVFRTIWTASVVASDD